MTETERAGYPPAIAGLVRKVPLMPLGPGEPDRSVKGELEALNEAAFGPGRVADRDMAAACRAGLWLAFGYLDESHTISQGLHTAEGSYWHAIMHRREPDADNSKYWFRRVGDHPVFEQLANEAHQLGLRPSAGRWDPFAFIDQCEAHRNSGDEQEMLLRQAQRREWELLFDWCFRRANGTG
jgi:hypothetical protein